MQKKSRWFDRSGPSANNTKIGWDAVWRPRYVLKWTIGFVGLVGIVFKNLRASTKLLLLCSMFVASIILATYSLIEEKQIAIGFVRKELVGVQYLESLRGVYAIILAEDSNTPQDAQGQASVDGLLNALTASETTAHGSPQTANLAQSLAAVVRRLSSAGSDGEKRALIVEALTKARDLAARIGDEFQSCPRSRSRQLLRPEYRREKSAGAAFRNGRVAITSACRFGDRFAVKR